MSNASRNCTIGSRLIQLRRKHNLTQSQLGEMCDVTKAAVSTWENGVAMPEIKKLLVIRSKLSFSFDWLIAGEGEINKVYEVPANLTERRRGDRRDSRQYDRRRMDRRNRQQDRRRDSGIR